MHVTWPNKSNVVTLSLATSMRKKNTTAVCREPFVLLSVLPLVLPTLRHISARKTPSVTGKKNFNCPSVPSGPRLQWTFPQKTASLPVSDRVRQLPVQKNVTSSLSRMFGGSGSQSLHILTASIWRQTGTTLKTHQRHDHDAYRHASLGAAAPAFCVNYTAVRL